jgi:hypothetical protein
VRGGLLALTATTGRPGTGTPALGAMASGAHEAGQGYGNEVEEKRPSRNNKTEEEEANDEG